MATLLIRNLDDSVRDGLRVRAAERGRSMEEEARLILADALERSEDDPDAQPGSGAALWARLRSVFADVGGVDLPEYVEGPYRPKAVWDDADKNDK